MKVVLVGCVISLIVLVSIAAYALEPLVLYDDFNAAYIDPHKWFGGQYTLPGGAGTEAIRQIQDHQLRLVFRSYGQMDSNSGRPRNELFLHFRNAAAVTAIQATVQVNDVAATPCPSNAAPTFAEATLGGRFFSTAPLTPESKEQDVVAFIGVQRGSDATDPPEVLRAVSAVRHCTNVSCSTGSGLHFQDLGPVKRGEKVRLRIQWDRDNHRFIFQRDEQPEVIAAYTVSDTAPPGFQVKILDDVGFVANCTAEPQPVAFMEAVFNDVWVNESAAPRAGR